MNTTITEILFTEAEISAAVGIDSYDLRALHPSYWGAPGHWRVCKTGGMLYTVKGASELADGLDRVGKAVESHSLRVLLRQRQETPSRALPQAAPKQETPWFRQAGME